MFTLVRHLLAIAALPFVVAVWIPTWLARRNRVAVRVGADLALLLVQLVGSFLVVAGLVLFISSLRRFATEGKGTLAPWDPPRRLVVRGPYRYVRNPMISGVVFLLFGEACVLLSWGHLKWALVFLALNLVYIPAFEEPQLRHRFGAAYSDYCQHVPRFLPRLRPWRPDAPDPTGAA
jgi:protein-S-isoprenylcysteine O-methyltransferase Ste14